MLYRMWFDAPDWVKYIVFGIVLPIVLLGPGAILDLIPTSREDLRALRQGPPEVHKGFRPAPFSAPPSERIMPGGYGHFNRLGD